MNPSASGKAGSQAAPAAALRTGLVLRQRVACGVIAWPYAAFLVMLTVAVDDVPWAAPLFAGLYLGLAIVFRWFLREAFQEFKWTSVLFLAVVHSVMVWSMHDFFSPGCLNSFGGSPACRLEPVPLVRLFSLGAYVLAGLWSSLELARVRCAIHALGAR